MKLSERQRLILCGLQRSNMYMSASEAGDPEVLELFELELVHGWNTMGGFSAWRLTPAGQAALEAEDA